MRLPAIAAIAAIVVACAVRRDAPPPPASTATATAGATLAIVGATVLPMTAADAELRDATVLVRDGRIVAVGPAAEVAVPAGAERVDGRGRFLVPGLVDAHVHLEYGDDPAILALFVASGVTTVRSMDGRPHVLDWRARTASGALVGPRIVTAGPILDGDPPTRDDNMVVRDAAAAESLVRAQADAGYDLVKVYDALSPAAYAGVVAAARARGLPVVGHVPNAVRVDGALAAGQRSLEHLAELGPALEAADSPFRGRWHWAKRYVAMPIDTLRADTLARRIAAAGAWVVPTLAQAHRELAPAESLAAWRLAPEMAFIPEPGRAIWDAQLRDATSRMDADDWALVAAGRANRAAVVRRLHAAGVRLAVGTDTPNPFLVPGASLHEELALLVAAGLPPAAALRMATAEGAALLGLADAGTIAVGRRADLVLVAADPRADVGALREPVGVVLGGRWHAGDALRSARRTVRFGGP